MSLIVDITEIVTSACFNLFFLEGFTVISVSEIWKQLSQSIFDIWLSRVRLDTLTIFTNSFFISICFVFVFSICEHIVKFAFASDSKKKFRFSKILILIDISCFSLDSKTTMFWAWTIFLMYDSFDWIFSEMLISQLSIVVDFFSMSIIKSFEFNRSFSMSILTFKSLIKWISLAMNVSAEKSFFVKPEKYTDMHTYSTNSCVNDPMSLTLNDVYIFLIRIFDSRFSIHALSANVASHSISKHINIAFIVDISFMRAWRKFQLLNPNSEPWSLIDALNVIILTIFWIFELSRFVKIVCFRHFASRIWTCSRFLEAKDNSQRLQFDSMSINSIKISRSSSSIFCSS